ncbi:MULTISPECIES: L,D-transpeptidase [Massilia]|jgi:lipoprotein-anchoring transpeptidase ErfK/SrfK|uniref:L,D-transpeptidase family protein n=1 Tax=Massilia TaxID=149698 RepID=UPI000D90ACA4|nr:MULTISPECIES: L,D-transpeptidase [Massilia]QYG02147.1 L,D-transpeptidase [Massilia sp. NP310]
MKKATALTLIAALGGVFPHAFAQQPVGQPAPVQQPLQQQAAPGTPMQAAPAPAGAVQDPAIAEQAEFERLLRAQVLLERQYLSPGEIDGAYGSNMRQALNTFQAQRNLPVTGKLDEATWNALNADASPTLAEYTIAAEDVAGPFQPIPDTMMGKAKLPALGYATALEGLGEKFHASPALLQRLNPGKSLAQAGERIMVPHVSGKQPLAPAAKVVVRDSTKTLQLYDAGGQLLAQYPVSTGSKRDPLPIGNWKINGVHANPVYNYNPKLFWDAKPGDSKTQIKPGPNNPVGVMWIDLSKPHYGIHGTPVPGHVGKTESHGCIRLTNWSAAEVGAVVGEDTDVELVK